MAGIKLKNTVNKVRKTIGSYRMLQRGDRVVVAVSGGPDSVCLLSILNEIREDSRIELIVAHFDHGLRPHEDEAETRFVKTLADSFHLPFVSEKASPGLRESRGQLEERARHARYRFLEKVRKDFCAQKIAVGHNLNDQAETFIMRLLRGSGPAGLSGIPPVRGDVVIRPLIEIPRKEVICYLEDKGLTYMTDPSNFSTRHLRNRIRLNLMPEMAKVQPRIVELLGQTARVMREDEDWMAGEARNWIKREAVTTKDNVLQLPLPSLTALPDAMRARIIRHSLDLAGGTLRRISRCHINSIDLVAKGPKPNAKVDLPNGLVVKRIYDRLLFLKGERSQRNDFLHALTGPGRYELPELDAVISVDEVQPSDVSFEPGSKCTVFLSADQLGYPLFVRNFRPGDKFIPLGMAGQRKLKDFFMDLKVPLDERSRVPILTYQDTPVWICGFRIDDRYKITSFTTRALKVSVLKQASESHE